MIIYFYFNIVCTIGNFGATSHREERRIWELEVKEGVLNLFSSFDSFGFHGRLEGVNI